VPAFAHTHAREVVVSASVLFVVHLLSDARLLRRTVRRFRRPTDSTPGAVAIPDGWIAGKLDDGTPFWFHCDAPDDIRFEAPHPSPVDGQPQLERPSSSTARPVVVLADYGLSNKRGCLLPERQVTGSERSLLPPEFHVLESMARDLPRLAEGTGGWRTVLAELNWTHSQQADALMAVIKEGQGAVQRARMVLVFLAQAWRCAPCLPTDTAPPVPQWIARLWEALHAIDRSTTDSSVPPLFLDYANYVLHNCETIRDESGRQMYGPVLLFTGGGTERNLLTCLLAIESVSMHCQPSAPPD
jgi:hypothetical protein